MIDDRAREPATDGPVNPATGRPYAPEDTSRGQDGSSGDEKAGDTAAEDRPADDRPAERQPS